MKRILFFLLISFNINHSLAQNSKQNFDLKAKIVSAETNEVLPYANVYNKQLTTGTASNLEGYFELPNNQEGDSIIISYLGFVDYEFVISKNLPSVIKLSPNPNMLNEITVTAKNDYLYELIASVKKNRKTKTRISKTYFFLESNLFGKPVEIIESYFNGQFSNYGMDELELKKGRIGLRAVNRRYFSSTESSQLFSMHNMFQHHNLFPDNPLLMKKNRMKRKYDLQLLRSYAENDSKIFVINFSPKKDIKELFSGTVWIDKENNKVIKVSFNLQDAQVHPFRIIGYNTIQQVDMQVTKTYSEIEGEHFINTIDFNYDVVYVDTTGNQMKSTTRAFTKAYDYQQHFTLPYFEFSNHYHEDYRNVIALDYDEVFWDHNTEYRFYDRLEKVENFIKKNRLTKNILYLDIKEKEHRQFEFPYIPWNSLRFKMRQAPIATIEKSQRNVAFESQRYKFNVKLYLDVNIIQDSLTYQIGTYLDPIGSFYHFFMSDNDRAFMNMYFDLMEIQKRKLEKELKKLKAKDIRQVDILHQKYINEFNLLSKNFVSDVARGKNVFKMKEWNRFIQQELQVNNLEFFQFEESSHD